MSFDTVVNDIGHGELDNDELLPKIVNGGIAGIVGVTCVFPIDLVKTRLQNQQVGPGGKGMMYSGIADCFKKTWRAGGLRGMYSGSGVNILLITPEKAIKLVANDFFRHKLTTEGSKQLSLWREVVAGGSAGFCQIIVTTPMELLKIQLQDAGRVAAKHVEGEAATATTAAVKRSATQVALGLVREKGLVGLYRGTGATMARDVTFSCLYFPLFARLDALAPRKSDGSGDAVFYGSFVAGITAGAFASFCVTPLDVIKTRLQLINRAADEASYSGVVSGVSRILRDEGWRALFKGAGCRMLVMAPLFGIAQTVYYIGAAELLMGIDKSKQVRH